MKILLNKNIKFNKNTLLKGVKRKNFSAVIFFDFFFEEIKILSLPFDFFLAPWGCGETERDQYESEYIHLTQKYPAVKHFEVDGNLFYTSIYLQGHTYQTSRKELYFFLLRFFNLNEKKRIIKGFAPYFISESYSFPFHIDNTLIENFGMFLEEIILNVLRKEANTAVNKIISELEKKYKKVRRIDNLNYDVEFDRAPFDEIEFFDFLNKLNMNFCMETPSNIKISLEKYFSLQEIIFFLAELEKYFQIKNPFEGEIETSIEEYRKFLLKLYGPGNWEYTNLDIEKLDLSIEELVCLNILLCKPSIFSFNDLYKRPVFLSNETCNSRGFYMDYEKFPYMYFWYKLKSVVLDKK